MQYPLRRDSFAEIETRDYIQERKMLQLSAKSYMTLCALVHDAMQVPSDASPILAQIASELALTDARLPTDLRNDPRKLAALRQSGFVRGQDTIRKTTPAAAVGANAFDAS